MAKKEKTLYKAVFYQNRCMALAGMAQFVGLWGLVPGLGGSAR